MAPGEFPLACGRPSPLLKAQSSQKHRSRRLRVDLATTTKTVGESRFGGRRRRPCPIHVRNPQLQSLETASFWVRKEQNLSMLLGKVLILSHQENNMSQMLNEKIRKTVAFRSM